MKKLLLLAVALVVATTSFAQKQSAEEIQKECISLFTSKNWKFVPYEVTNSKGVLDRVGNGSWMLYAGDNLVVKLPRVGEIDEQGCEPLKYEESKGKLYMDFKVDRAGAITTYKMVVNTKNGEATLRITSNRNSDKWDYKGYFQKR